MEKNVQTRANSPVIFLFSIQNFIKSLLISEVTHKNEGLSVLDLCCGKGGDIPAKWARAHICHYVGVDLSANSVREARTRYLDSVVDNDRVKSFPAIFIVADCGDQNNLLTDILANEKSLKQLKRRIVFDVVST
jgi:ubiquinone/menaquinone biosynthesis C-methylase UbiE